jgi:hypothetical protein
MEDRTGTCRVLAGKTDGENHMKHLDLYERTILKWIFKTWDAAHGLD